MVLEADHSWTGRAALFTNYRVHPALSPEPRFVAHRRAGKHDRRCDGCFERESLGSVRADACGATASANLTRSAGGRSDGFHGGGTVDVRGVTGSNESEQLEQCVSIAH